MEAIAWLTHKYVMHGPFWSIHRDHHQPDKSSFFERNDLFFILFALPGIALIYFGFINPAYEHLLMVGIGISAYGIAYLLVHDLIIHQRLRILSQSKNIYIAGLRRAHRLHHKHTGKYHGECFGMLFVPIHVWQDILKRKKIYK
ncbi:MAG: carotene hydroxylase [Calditrichaeota bacterium]|nr:MAG: carotene hydroxylase [Calditrichota bacterium]